MGYHSGKWGVLSGESTVRNWSVTSTSSPFMYRASNTKAGAGRVDGVKDWTGSFGQLGGIPSRMPGDIVPFLGYTAPDNDVYGGDGKVYSGNVIIDQVAITWNWGGGEALSIAYSFSGVGPLAELTDYHDDVTTPQEYPICATKIDHGAAAAEVDLENISTATLTFVAENPSSVNSSSQCWTNRVAGPIDWNASITLEDNSFPLAVGTTERFRFFIDSTDFFELKWAIVREYSGLNVDREGGGIIGSTMNIDMDGVDNTGTLGSITLPGAGTPWWPKAAVTTLSTVAGRNDNPSIVE